ncbi:hypothetical protein GCM10010269_42270 [Streptomyces humidus]|uniref:ATP-binding protein n=1 Tax=Streptomyces humidus TaxID=52259 RepID=A0A918L4E0_9ACTN|nr:hypothetical protein [Streptomyces humidus]GGR99003.1 hypothetical protein GCM10010269_42270 [Streptomyces humidus]
MARHASPQSPTGRRALAALATAGVALGAGAGSAAAAGEPAAGVARTSPSSAGRIDPQAGLQGALGSLSYATGTLAGLKPNPLAGTGVDPLDNGVGTQLADFRPLTSRMLTGPVAQAQSIGSIPVVGDVTKLLGG